MKLKRCIAALLTVCICISCSGCGFIDGTDEMVSPPELTGEMAPIANALYKVAGNDCDLKYPADGKYRSAIVLEDIDTDGVFEAFAFYSTSGDEMTTMHINVIRQSGDEWKSIDDKTIVATGVEMVEFCDLNADGIKEILIGWDVNGVSEKQLSVFTFDHNALSQQLLQAYTSFLCCDLDDNGTSELFVHQLNAVEKTNMAMIYNYEEDAITQTAGCIMDGSVKSASAPMLATLSTGEKAIYIDEVKGVGSVTEVLYNRGGELVNPLLDNENLLENISTLRAASIPTADINDDGVLEIPVASELPNAKSDGETLYYTNWCAFDGKKLSVKMVTVVNTVDGYYLKIPSKLVGNIAALKDIENRQRKFYNFDTQNNLLGNLLFVITAVKADRWDSSDFARGNNIEIARTSDTVFVAELGDGAEDITVETLKEIFYITNVEG